MKKLITLGAALALWIVTVGLTAGSAQDKTPFDGAQIDSRHGFFDRDLSSTERERIRRGFEINPVKLDIRGKNIALVGLGSYEVNTGGCNDCHTNPPYAPGGDPFQGQQKIINAAAFLGGGTPFGPGLVSANLTPDAQGRPAGLTFDEFKKVLRTGVDPEDGHILQVMPWPVFQDKIDRDLRAIYEYLRSIPSIP